MVLHQYDKKLILEDGSFYYGTGFGCDEERFFEIVFNTSPVGYQEILSDPSYTDQGVVMAYPLIGNYGIAAEDFESKTPSISAMIVREYCPEPSNWRSIMPLEEVMKRYRVVGLSGIDTRRLIQHIRDHGSCRAMITDISSDIAEAVARLKSYKLPTDAVSRVSRKKAEKYRNEAGRFHVVAIDCGMKENIIRSLVKRGCDVTVLRTRGNQYCQRTARQAADLRHLPGASDTLPVVWRKDLQTEIRSPRRQPSHKKPFYGQNRNHRAKPLLRGESEQPAKHTAHCNAYQPAG